MHSLDSPVLQWSMVALCVTALGWTCMRLMVPHKAIYTHGAAAVVAGYLCRESEVAEVAMLAAMAAMFAYPAAPGAVWQIAFAGIGVALAVQVVTRRLKPGGLSGERIVAACNHLLGVVAMLYTTIGHSGHAEHVAGHGGPPLPVLGWIFATVFAVDAVVSAGVVIAAPQRFASSRARLVAATAPHVVMDVAMVVMLYAALAAGSGQLLARQSASQLTWRLAQRTAEEIMVMLN